MPDVSLRKAGQTAVVLPTPGREHERTLEKLGPLHVSLAGARTQQTMARKRTWVLNWRFLPDADFALIEQFHDTADLGPFEYRSPTEATVRSVLVRSLTDRVETVGYHSHVTLVLDEA